MLYRKADSFSPDVAHGLFLFDIERAVGRRGWLGIYEKREGELGGFSR
jgi:hypothetical protein